MGPLCCPVEGLDLSELNWVNHSKISEPLTRAFRTRADTPLYTVVHTVRTCTKAAAKKACRTQAFCGIKGAILSTVRTVATVAKDLIF